MSRRFSGSGDTCVAARDRHGNVIAERHSSSSFELGRFHVSKCDACGDTLITVGDGGIHFSTWPEAVAWMGANLADALIAHGPRPKFEVVR